MAIVRYAGNRMTGVSGDTKPTEGSLITGTTFHETNTDDLYIWDGDSWNVVASNTVAETLSSKTLTSPVINTGLSGSAFLDEDNFASDSATKVASQQSIKAYVASQIPGSQNVFSTLAVSGQDNVVADGSTDTLTLVASTNMTITTTAGSDTITFASAGSTTLDGLTDTDVGSLSSAHILIYDGSNSWDNKAVGGDITIGADGVVAIGADKVTGTMIHANAVDDSSLEQNGTQFRVKATGVTNAMLAGSIANGKLANSSITVSDGSNTTAIALGGTATFAGTANEVTVAESSGTVTIGLPDNVTIAGNLTVSGDTVTASTSTVTIEDPLMALANNNTGNAVDIGFFGKYRTNGTDLYTGLVWDGSASQYILFHANQAAPGTTVNTGGTGHAVSTLVANITGNVSGSSGTATGNAGSSTQLQSSRGFSISGDITANAVAFNGTGDVGLSAAITAGVIVNADVNASAAIVDTKLATISTADKVAGGAIQIDSGTDGTGITIAATDKFLVDDGGTTKYVNASQILTYTSGSGASESFAIAMAVAL